MLRKKIATVVLVVSEMLISDALTWQQRLVFCAGIVFGLVVEALPELLAALTERCRLSKAVKRSKAA